MTPTNSELEDFVQWVSNHASRWATGKSDTWETSTVRSKLTKLISKREIEARISERIMQGEENNLENYRKARLNQLTELQEGNYE